MVVSMTAVGPVGTTGGLTLLVVLGASGRASAGGGGVDCAGVDCAWTETTRARESARVRSIMRFVAPTNRLTQTGCGSNVAALCDALDKDAFLGEINEENSKRMRILFLHLHGAVLFLSFRLEERKARIQNSLCASHWLEEITKWQSLRCMQS